MNKLETVKNLPDSQQLQLVQAVNELSARAGQIEQILETFDQITEAQRQSIQALADQISQQATSSLQQQLLMLSGKTDTLEKTLLKVNQSAELLEKAQKPISSAAWKIHESAQEIQRQPWRRLLIVAAVAAILSASLTLGGMHGLKQLQQNPEIKDVQLQQLLDRATPAEQNLMLEIYKRPNK